MLLVTLIGAVLAAGAAPVKVAAPGLAVVNVDPALKGFWSEHLAQQLKLAGVQVITAREMESLLGLERQKQLLGCGDQAGSCMAGFANALGADGVVLGDIARSGSKLQVNLKIVDARDARTLALFSDSATEDSVVDVLTEGANKLAIDASAALGRPAPVRLAATRTNLRKVAIAPLAIGVVGLVAGSVFLAISESAWGELERGVPGDRGPALASQGQLYGPLAVAGFVVGGAALVAGLALFIFGGDSPVVATVGPTGASVSLRGTFP